MLQSDIKPSNLNSYVEINALLNSNLKKKDFEIESVEDTVEKILLTRDIYQDQPFAVFDLDVVRHQYELYQSELPGAVPFYAVKCNPDPGVIKKLIKLGGGFDCASLSEMKLVLGLGASPNMIIFAHPCKLVPHLQFAYQNGVKKMTVDNLDELDSIKRHCPNAELVIRIATDDKSSLIPLSGKFGVPVQFTDELLERAAELRLSVIGASFHVGGNCNDANAYRTAISDAKLVFNVAKSYGFNCHFLDIGGGFSNSKTHPNSLQIQDLSPVIRSSVSDYFNDIPDLTLIGEPGQFMVASCMSLVTQVTARRLFRSGQPGIDNMYYINDGTHGTLNGIIYNFVPPYKIYRKSKLQLKEINVDKDSETFPSCVWGPTCNSMDKVISNQNLPLLQIGDYLIFQNVGAYRTSVGSEFNGFGKPDAFYLN